MHVKKEEINMGVVRHEEKSTFGFKVTHFVGMAMAVCAFTNVFNTTVLPPPVGPTSIVECLVSIVSYN